MSENIRFSVSFALIAKLCEALGVSHINKLDGCWEYKLDDNWFIAVNGHRKAMKANGVTVQPFHCYVEFNGWPAGDLSPFGGWIAADAEANEDAFIQALKAATDKAAAEKTMHRPGIQNGLAKLEQMS